MILVALPLLETMTLTVEAHHHQETMVEIVITDEAHLPLLPDDTTTNLPVEDLHENESFPLDQDEMNESTVPVEGGMTREMEGMELLPLEAVVAQWQGGSIETELVV